MDQLLTELKAFRVEAVTKLDEHLRYQRRSHDDHELFLRRLHSLIDLGDTMHNQPHLHINWNDVVTTTEHFIFNAAAKNIPGNEKMDMVLDELMQYLDDAITPKRFWQETLSDIGLKALRELLRIFVQYCFDELRARSEV